MEEPDISKALAYITIAIILGLAMTLIPTSLFLVQADQYGKLAEAFASAENWRIPLLGDSERNHTAHVSSTEVEILGISFFVALAIYVLFKRKTPRHDYIWPSFRSY